MTPIRRAEQNMRAQAHYAKRALARGFRTHEPVEELCRRWAAWKTLARLTWWIGETRRQREGT